MSDTKDFSGLNDHMIGCIRIGSHNQMVEVVKDMADILTNLRYLHSDVSFSSRYKLEELGDKIKELTDNYNLYLKCRTYQVEQHHTEDKKV